jgi:hypothetical protein
VRRPVDRLIPLPVIQKQRKKAPPPRSLPWRSRQVAGTTDEDMASTHMTMLIELHGGQGDQQGHPNREEGPKLIQFESPRWRPKSSSSLPRNPGLVYLELVTQDASGLRFR